MIEEPQSTILNNGYLVSRVRSVALGSRSCSRYADRYIYQRIGHFAVFLLPIGVICGAIFSLIGQPGCAHALLVPHHAPPRPQRR